MSDTLESPRARVEAAQALIPGSTPGPWSVCPQWGEVLAPSGAFVVAEGDPDARLMAAAPDLVTQLTEALALAESQAKDLDKTRAWSKALAHELASATIDVGMARMERDEARAELTAVRTALGNGADEAAWKPGETVAQAVERLRGVRAAVVAYLRTLPDSHRVGGQIVGTSYSPAAVRALKDAADAIERGDFWPKAGALADDGGTRG